MGCTSTEPAPGAVLPVRVHTLPGCDLPSQPARGNLDLVALGDFEASNDSAEVLAVDSKRGTPLKFPLTTRAIEASIQDAGKRFIGYGERRVEDRFDVLLWPELETCSLFRPGGSVGYPGRHGGQAFGYAASRGFVLAAGGNDPQVSDAVVGAMTFDVDAGSVEAFDTSQGTVLREARAFATASELGQHLLIAGGENPVYGVLDDDLEPRATGELFDTQLGELVGEPIKINPRTRHAAVTLADGNVLLVGGRSLFVDSNIELITCELVSADSLRVTPVATLRTGRIEPTALRLDDGRIFVGGGYLRNGRVARPAGEWLTPDGTDNGRAADGLPPRFDRAFVATAGGGVLAVGGCEDRAAASEDESLACGRTCRRGCPPTDADGAADYDAWWLARDGLPTPISLKGISAPRPILLPGSDGGPWLIAALVGASETPRLFRFDPWHQRFDLVDTPEGLRLPSPDMPAPVAIDPDAFVWLDDDDRHGELFGLRLGTRNRYAQDLALVLLSDPEDPSRPLHLVPDRPLSKGEIYDGRLWLTSAAPGGGVRVAIADTDYGDFTLELELAAPNAARDIPESVPPVVLLDQVELGGDACPWPEGQVLEGAAALPIIARNGASAELRFHGATRACSVPERRVKLAVRAAAGVSVITKLDLKRGGAPAR